MIIFPNILKEIHKIKYLARLFVHHSISIFNSFLMDFIFQRKSILLVTLNAMNITFKKICYEER